MTISEMVAALKLRRNIVCNTK